MKILVIMKRFGANKDMVLQNFGRQIRLFEPLAKKHNIDFLCPDYIKMETKEVKVNGIRYLIRQIGFLSFFRFLNETNQLIKKEKYNAIVATTDPLIGIMGYYCSKKFRLPLIYDLQDNFEMYGTYKIPLVPYLHKKVVKEANVVLTVSESLRNYISKIRKKSVYTIQNGIDELFKTIDKNSARKKLKLPLNAKIIVYIGHLEKLKGADILFEAFNKVKEKYRETYLLISGQIEKGIDIKQKNVIFREFPKREYVVLGINAADVAILPNTFNDFTKYCFPYKIVEYMACRVPIVATDIGDVSLLLKKYKGSLCKPNADDLANKIINKLKYYKRIDYSNELKELEWKILAEKMNRIITSINH